MTQESIDFDVAAREATLIAKAAMESSTSDAIKAELLKTGLRSAMAARVPALSKWDRSV